MRHLTLIVTLLGSAASICCGGGSGFSSSAAGNTGGSGLDVGGSSSTGGAAGGSSSGPDLSQLPELYAEGMCAALANCSSAAAGWLLGSNDCPTLLAGQIENASLPGIQAAVAAGTAIYDPTAMTGCRDAIAAAGCSFTNNLSLPACEAALGGTVLEGGACALDEECKGDLYCKYDGSCPGTCSAREAADALCRKTSDCQSGFTCFISTGSTGRCTTKPTLGDACGYDLPNDCAPESGDAIVCWGANSTTRGKCTAVNAIASHPIGDACSVLSSPSQLCKSGASCQFASVLLTGTCVAPSSVTDSCPFAFPDPCAKDQYCTATDPKTPGQCNDLPTEGQPCLTGTIPIYSNKVCADQHTCIAGNCVKYRANGAACTSNAVCYSGRCDSQSQQCVPNQNCDVVASH